MCKKDFVSRVNIDYIRNDIRVQPLEWYADTNRKSLAKMWNEFYSIIYNRFLFCTHIKDEKIFKKRKNNK